MSETIVGLRRKIAIAGDLQSVVRTMKILAASNIGEYEKSVRALEDYYRAVELGLAAYFRDTVTPQSARPDPTNPAETPGKPGSRRTGIGVIVFGSDQGLVGRFNEAIASYAIRILADMPGTPYVWAVGERVHAYLADAGLEMAGLFPVPNVIEAIAPLIGQLQYETEIHRIKHAYENIFVFHNRPLPGVMFEPVHQRLLPLDSVWLKGLSDIPWPTNNLPEVVQEGTDALRALIREYLFITLFRACAESLTSENESRLAAMERAERNISDLQETLRGAFNRLRQASIDAELFDVISGYEALSSETTARSS